MYSSSTRPESGTDGVNVFRRVSHVHDLSLLTLHFLSSTLFTSPSSSHTWPKSLAHNAQQYAE